MPWEALKTGQTLPFSGQICAWVYLEPGQLPAQERVKGILFRAEPDLHRCILIELSSSLSHFCLIQAFLCARCYYTWRKACDSITAFRHYYLNLSPSFLSSSWPLTPSNLNARDSFWEAIILSAILFFLISSWFFLFLFFIFKQLLELSVG